MNEPKTCQYCDGGNHDIDADRSDYWDGVVVGIEWDDGMPRICATGYYDDGYICGVKDVDIQFCPFCGRRLVKDAD